MGTVRKFGIAALGAALTVVGLQFIPAGAAPTKRDPDYCRESGALSAATLPARVAADDCDLRGRLITSGNVALRVPPPGHGVTADAIGPSGEVGLYVATMPNGDVRIDGGSSGRVALVLGEGANDPCGDGYATGCLDACVDTNHSLKPGKPRVKKGQPWYFKGSSKPDELTLDEARTHIKLGSQNIVKTNNDCGLSDVVDKPAPYKGGTSNSADMAFPNGANGCKKVSRTDGKNVVDFGKLISPTVGLACSYLVSRDGVKWFIKQADIRLRIDGGDADPTDTEWTTDPAAEECSIEMDVQSVMTHERGHAFGLGHADSDESHFMQTMYPFGPPCYLYARTLGKGDRAGLNKLY